MPSIPPLHCFSLEEYNKLNTIDEYYHYCNFMKPFYLEDIMKYGIINNDLSFTRNKAYYYKNKIYYNLYDFCVNYYNINNFDANKYMGFFQELIETNRGQHLLKKINLSSLTKNNKRTLLIYASLNGTLPTFIHILNLCNNMDINHIELFINSCSNTDSRLYCYYLKEKKSSISLTSINFFDILTTMVSSQGIPDKYLFRRLRKINTTLDNSMYYGDIIKHLYYYPPIFVDLMKYYYIKNNIYNQIDFYKYIAVSALSNESDIMYKLFNYIDNDIDKNNLYLILVKCCYNISTINTYHTFNMMKYTKNIIEKLFNNIDFAIWDYEESEDSFYNLNNMELKENRSFFINILKKYKFSNCFYKNELENYNKTMLLYPFLNKSKIPLKFKHLKIVNKLYNKLYEKKKYNELYNTIINNNDYTFTLKHPSHLTKSKLNIIENIMYIKNKADGSTTYNIPECFPKNDLSKYNLIGEYIESLDLYLVFDIDINKSFKDRYKLLRKMHPFVKDYDIKHINNIKDMAKFNEMEDLCMKEFLNKPYEGYRWYPKVCYSIDKTTILKNIKTIMEKDTFNTNIYPTDGYIIVNKNKKYKIKPKEKLTIDIIYKNNNWYDRNNNIVANIITDIKSDNNTIWRCYPKIINKELYFINKEIRFDKNKPNPRIVIDEVITTYLWKDNYYYQFKSKANDYNLKCIINNNKHFKNIITDMKISGKVLDIGCGKAKLLNYIKPKLYIGIDNDMRILKKNMNKYNKKYNIIFKNIDMNNNIEKILQFIPKIHFDYIILNFSINHFYNKDIWKLLKTFCNIKTKIIFNITNHNIINKKIMLNKGFISSDGKTTRYLFPWCHNNIVTEKYISEKQLYNDIMLYDFKINEIKLNKETPLENIYNWYVLN
jgi:SAM-dependent methyltransferase